MSTPAAARRPQAPRLARPAVRYWKGKAPKGVQDAPSDSDEEEEEQVEETRDEQDEEITDIMQRDESEEEEDDGGKPKKMNIALKDVDIRDGKVIVAGREESGRTDLEQQALDEPSEEGEEEDQAKEGEEEESSEYESSSEEEEPPKPQFRPVFVPKRGRATIAEREALAQDTEEALKRKEAEAEERKKQSHDLVAESIRRELAEKEKEEQVPDLDDTDGLDPEAEFEAWKLRELGRIKRDKEDELRREREREEVERRRALPEEQRMREDLEHAQKLREEKPKGQQKFLQKYWHKGAFHQDEEILKKRDYTEATESTVDVSLLPKVMQVRNFGKRSQTKYTHLVDQDTSLQLGGFGGAAPVKAGGKSTDTGGCFICGGPHMKKDCPQNPGPGFHGRLTGANSTQTGPRSWKGDSGEWRDRDRDREDARPSRPPPPKYDGNSWQDKSSRRRSRSRSPRRHRDDDHRRSRSRTPPRRHRDDDRYERRRRSRSRERARVDDDDHREKRRRYD